MWYTDGTSEVIGCAVKAPHVAHPHTAEANVQAQKVIRQGWRTWSGTRPFIGELHGND